MSRLSLETVQRLYAAMNARDVARAIELAAPDAEWIPGSASKPFREPDAGRM